MTVEWKYYSQKLGWKWSKAMDGSYGLPYIAVNVAILSYAYVQTSNNVCSA